MLEDQEWGKYYLRILLTGKCNCRVHLQKWKSPSFMQPTSSLLFKNSMEIKRNGKSTLAEVWITHWIIITWMSCSKSIVGQQNDAQNVSLRTKIPHKASNIDQLILVPIHLAIRFWPLYELHEVKSLWSVNWDLHDGWHYTEIIISHKESDRKIFRSRSMIHDYNTWGRIEHYQFIWASLPFHYLLSRILCMV